jgi:hypothetical protein
MRINVKNHQIPETKRVEIADGLTSEPENISTMNINQTNHGNLPCCINVPMANQSVLLTVKRFSR